MTTPAPDPRIPPLLDAHPRLHLWGYGNPPPTSDFTLAQAREELILPGPLTRIARAEAWIRARLEPTRTRRRRAKSSYSWKHVYEHEPDGAYCENGVFILAALLAGIELDDLDAYNPTLLAVRKMNL